MFFDIFKVQDSIIQNLSDYLKSNSKYNPYVKTRVTENQLPLVVLEEARNEQKSRTTDYKCDDRVLNYNINIFAKDTQEEVSQVICKELAQLVSEVMENYYHASGGMIGILPRYDGTSVTYQLNMRYTIKYIPSKDLLY